MSTPHGQFCPGCGTAQKPVARYPWRLCAACMGLAVDGAGRALEFANESLSGGFLFRYTGEAGWIACRGVVALVRDRPVRIGEARFGGVVAEPLPARPWLEDGVIDVRRGEKVSPPEQRPDKPIGRGR